MRKMLVIASREYQAAVRTKTFIVGLLVMPLLMGGSIVIQLLLRDLTDTRDRSFAIIDRTEGQKLAELLKQRIDRYNAHEIYDSAAEQIKPRFLVETIDPSPDQSDFVNRQRYELSERVRTGELLGFVEIDRAAGAEMPLKLRYQTNRVTYRTFAKYVEVFLAETVRDTVSAGTKLTAEQRKLLLEPVKWESVGLTVFDATTGAYRDSQEGLVASAVVPGLMLVLMFMVVLMVATPLMQGVVEEKMQRIAEVLLGSVRPFQLMMGKLLGMTGVSLTIAAVYLGGSYWAAAYWGVADAVSPYLLVWFVVYQIMAALMYGSLFIAVGAACTDMRETQNLLWPVMLLCSIPLFFVGSVIQEPNSPVATALSFFPFSTPMLMIARQAVPPGIPWWQPVLGVLLTLAATIVCVYAAGRIFRIGILMQGKGAKLSQMVKWVFRG